METGIFPTLLRVVKVKSNKEVYINVNTGTSEEAWCRQGTSIGPRTATHSRAKQDMARLCRESYVDVGSSRAVLAHCCT